MKRLIVLFGLLMAFTPFTFAQSAAEVIWDQLQEEFDDANDDGYTLTNYVMGAINEDDSSTWSFTFNRRSDYRFVAVCDNDCDDVDLFLYDEDGDLVEEDTSVDYTPTIEFSPRRTDTYQIKILMYNCDIEPCYFGLGIFED